MRKYHSLTAVLMLAGIFSWSLMSCSVEDHEIVLQYNEHKNIVESSEFTPYMDMNTFAGDDFYQYAVGKWLAENPLSYGESVNGTYSVFSEKSKDFIDNVEAIIAGDEVFKRLKSDFNPSAASADLKLLMQKLAAIDAVATKEDMYKKMGELMIEGYSSPFVLVPSPFCRRVEIVVSLPEPDHFTMENEALKDRYQFSREEAVQMEKVINDWTTLVAKEKKALGASACRTFDESLYLSHSSGAGRRASSNAPLVLMLQCTGYGAGELTSLLEDYKNINQFFADMSLADLKRFTKYVMVNRDDDFIILNPEAKAEDAIKVFLMGDYNPLNVRLSALYNKTIPAANRIAAVEMAKEYREAFRERINKLTWMSDVSKARAIEKLDAMMLMIGWTDDESRRDEWMPKLTAQKSSYYEDICSIYKQMFQIILKKLGSKDPYDFFYSSEISTPSFHNNAYYQRSNNNILITTNALKQPMFDAKRSDAFNYGTLGAIIGHEMTHGFDMAGKDYDKDGLKKAWMLPADAEAFAKLSQKQIDFFNKQTYGVYTCNGLLTRDENIADLGGLYIGYDALMKLLDKKGVSGAERDRQTRDYFRAFGYLWMENSSENYQRGFLTSDHSLSPVRVLGNVYQLNEFYRVFHIQNGKRFLKPEERIEIW